MRRVRGFRLVGITAAYGLPLLLSVVTIRLNDDTTYRARMLP
jgi:hypothetical protein